MSDRNSISFDPEHNELFCRGEWTFEHLLSLKHALAKLHLPALTEITINGKEITQLDSAGAWLLGGELKKLYPSIKTIHWKNFSEQHKKFLSLSKKQATHEKIPKPKKLGWRAELGKYSIRLALEFRDYLNFLGHLLYDSAYLLNPKYWRFRTVVHVINQTGSKALPIIGLLSFMIGVVISYQMGNQLRNYGASTFIVNLMGFSVLREFGPLLTAIMVAGRTGSAFTAQFGLMKVNQEIDALSTMGITTNELLIFPRLIGLIIVLPLLTIWADFWGIVGGMMMANNLLDVSWHEFLTRFQREIPLRTLFIGLAKAPLFALIIASIGCFQGMKVKGSAEEVGDRTTRSVVLSIFFIIVADAFISILLSRYKL